MYKNLLIFLCFFAFHFTAFTQNNVNYNSLGTSTNNYYEAEGLGTRYFFNEKYRAGELWTKTGHFMKEFLFRFDRLEGTLQLKLPNGKELLVEEKSIIMFHLFIKGKKIVFVKHYIPKVKRDVLLQVIYYSPNLQLLRDLNKTIVKKRDNRIASILKIEVEDEFKYYITKNDYTPLEEIKLDSESLIKKFPEHSKKITQFFKYTDYISLIPQTKLNQLMDILSGNDGEIEYLD